MKRIVANRAIDLKNAVRFRNPKMYALISADQVYVYYFGEWHHIYDDQEGDFYIKKLSGDAFYFDLVDFTNEIHAILSPQLAESAQEFEARTGEKANW